jgi:hypothetical protein
MTNQGTTVVLGIPIPSTDPLFLKLELVRFPHFWAWARVAALSEVHLEADILQASVRLTEAAGVSTDRETLEGSMRPFG